MRVLGDLKPGEHAWVGCNVNSFNGATALSGRLRVTAKGKNALATILDDGRVDLLIRRGYSLRDARTLRACGAHPLYPEDEPKLVARIRVRCLLTRPKLLSEYDPQGRQIS